MEERCDSIWDRVWPRHGEAAILAKTLGPVFLYRDIWCSFFRLLVTIDLDALLVHQACGFGLFLCCWQRIGIHTEFAL